MDIIFIQGLKIETVIGVNEWEKKIHQTLIFDLEMSVDGERAAYSDDIEATVDYKNVAKFIREWIHATPPCQLVETLADRLAKEIMQQFSISWMRLKIGKPGAVKGAAVVGISIERGLRS